MLSIKSKGFIIKENGIKCVLVLSNGTKITSEQQPTELKAYLNALKKLKKHN